MRGEISISHDLVLLVLGDFSSRTRVESYDHAPILPIEFGRERPVLPRHHRAGVIPSEASHLKRLTVELLQVLERCAQRNAAWRLPEARLSLNLRRGGPSFLVRVLPQYFYGTLRVVGEDDSSGLGFSLANIHIVVDHVGLPVGP